MADITFTSSQVTASADATWGSGTAGATLVVGDVIKFSSSNDKYLLADADDDIEVTPGDVAIGICMNSASDGQPIHFVTKDPSFDWGAAAANLAAGGFYSLSTNAGKVGALADIGAGEYQQFLGCGLSTQLMNLNPNMGNGA